uniref:Zinc finger protein 277 n=1 Tax=Chelonoidis abingdonii TaxID=106734 RepID=A0A8C0QNW3_CHEAB
MHGGSRALSDVYLILLEVGLQTQTQSPQPSGSVFIGIYPLTSLQGLYILYWKKRFTEQPITDFCSVIRTNSEAPIEEQDNYFLLCDVLPEDRLLREQLQQKRLREILEQQQRERNDTSFHSICMFCDKEFTGNRSVLFNHMARDHAFNVGLPDNIVNCNEFLAALQKKLDNLQCLYCEKIFRDKNTLKDHMRKKQHRRINAKNTEYDRFYIINYLEFGKSWEEVQSEDDRELLDNVEEDWSDWEEHPVCAVCLFCEKQADTTEKLCLHMKEAHGFDFLKIKTEHGLKFYQQVKLVNFIRREIHQCRCYNCKEMFQSKTELINHMEITKHITFLPTKSTWDQPQYVLTCVFPPAFMFLFDTAPQEYGLKAPFCGNTMVPRTT